ncbi:hypothetical protein GE09DRAFT_1160352, partial [Coniochaeta sp. 2T2.1]
LTGLFVALACIIVVVGGIDKEKLSHDREQGILYYNNIEGRKPKEKVGDEEANGEKPSKAKKVLGLGKT